MIQSLIQLLDNIKTVNNEKEVIEARAVLESMREKNLLTHGTYESVNKYINEISEELKNE